MYSRKEEAILSSYTNIIEPAAAICIIQFFEEAAKYMIERSAISKALTLYASFYYTGFVLLSVL